MMPALQWPRAPAVSVRSVAPHKALLLSGCTRSRLAAAAARALLKPQEMSLPPSPRVSAEGVTLYTGRCAASPVSGYCHGSGETGLPNASASLARGGARDYKPLRHRVLQRAPSCAAVPAAEPLLCSGRAFLPHESANSCLLTLRRATVTCPPIPKPESVWCDLCTHPHCTSASLFPPSSFSIPVRRCTKPPPSFGLVKQVKKIPCQTYPPSSPSHPPGQPAE